MRAYPTPKTALPFLLIAALTAWSPSLAHAQAPPAPKDQADQPQSIPDQGGKQEPSAKGAPPSEPAKPQPKGNAPFVDGSQNVPGADTNTQTSPAKFSEKNAALDKIPLMGRGPPLSDQDKTVIWGSVKPGTTPKDGIGGPSTELPNGTEMIAWPPNVIERIPALRGTKYVGLSDRLLVVWPDNGIIVSEIVK